MSDPSKKGALKKQCMRMLPQRINDIYVTSVSDIATQLSTAHRLLEQGYQCNVYGIGSAINRAINLSLQLKEISSDVEYYVTSSSVNIDQLQFLELPLPEPGTRGRNVTMIHITLWKK